MKGSNKNNISSQNNSEGFNSPKVIPVSNQKKKKQRESSIPQVVANRMARRVAITTGIPTVCGMGVFIGSYFIISRGIADISPTVTLVCSALFFLIGLIGLSFGILSASWDNVPGSLIGLENIRPNISRVRDAINSSK